MNLEIYNELIQDFEEYPDSLDYESPERATKEKIKAFAELFPEKIPTGRYHLSDFYGTLRCEFKSKNRRVVFSGLETSKHSYVYFEDTEHYDVEKPLTKKLVLKYLKWLQEDGN